LCDRRRDRSGGAHEPLQRGHDRRRLLRGCGGAGRSAIPQIGDRQLQAKARCGHPRIVTQRIARRHCSEHQYTCETLSSIPRMSVPDHVFAQLREAILGGRYRPGERLPSQRALAADLNVNMASVREALWRLEQLRLVEVRHGEATRVLDWRRSGGLEALVLRGSADEALMSDLFEARRLLLVEAARLAAERRSDEQAASLL